MAEWHRRSAFSLSMGSRLLLGGCFLALGLYAVAAWIERERHQEKVQAKEELRRLLHRAHLLASDCIRARLHERDVARQRLQAEAERCCGEAAQILRDGWLRRELDRTKKENLRLQREQASWRKEEANLRRLLETQKREMEELVAAFRLSTSPKENAPLFSPSNVDPMTATNTGVSSLPASSDSSSLPKVSPSLPTPEWVPESPDLALLGPPSSASLSSSFPAGKEHPSSLSSGAPNPESSLESQPISPPEEEKATSVQTVIEEVQDALKRLLPAGGTMCIRQGEEILFQAGEGAKIEATRAEAMREILLPSEAEKRGWRIEVALSDSHSPSPPTAIEIATLLADQLASEMPATFRGSLCDEKGDVVAVFSLRERGGIGKGARFVPSTEWEKEENHEGIVWIWRDTLLALPATPWSMGGEIVWADRPVATRLWTIATRERGTLPLALLLLAGGIVAGVMGRKGLRTPDQGSSAPSYTLTRREGEAIEGETILAEIDENGKMQMKTLASSFRRARSLAILQERHRGGVREGSRILRHARSPILRSLARKVRPQDPSSSVSKASETSAIASSLECRNPSSRNGEAL